MNAVQLAQVADAIDALCNIKPHIETAVVYDEPDGRELGTITWNGGSEEYTFEPNS